MFSNNDDIVAQSCFWFGEDGFEPYSISLFHKLASQANFVFDIGAFTGLYSLCAIKANPQAKIVTFEPSRSTWERAKINFVANKVGAQIDFRNNAVGDKNGTVEFHHYRPSLVLQAGASYVRKEGKEIYSTEVVTVVVGDDVVNEVGGMDLVKIDVEGAEFSVINGLRQSIALYKPTIIIEIETSNYDRVFEFFVEQDYTLKCIDEIGCKFVDAEEGRNAVSNYCAVHVSKKDKVARIV